MAKRNLIPKNALGDVDMRPNDGYSAELHDNQTSARIELWIVFKVKGVLTHKWLARSWPDPTWISRGEADRALLLLQAFCRFLSTGGEVDELQTTMDKMHDLTAVGELGTISFGDDWSLLCSELVGDTFEHVFGNEKEEVAIQWSEGSFVEQMSYDTFLEWQETVNDLEETKCQENPDAKTEDSG